jgi:hypothetical protein
MKLLWTWIKQIEKCCFTCPVVGFVTTEKQAKEPFFMEGSNDMRKGRLPGRIIESN